MAISKAARAVIKPSNCLGMFVTTLVVSAFVGALLVGVFAPSMPDESMKYWLASVIGGNLGPLVIDLARRQLYPPSM